MPENRLEELARIRDEAIAAQRAADRGQAVAGASISGAVQNVAEALLSKAEYRKLVTEVQQHPELAGKSSKVIHQAMIDALNFHREELLKRPKGQKLEFTADYVVKAYRKTVDRVVSTSPLSHAHPGTAKAIAELKLAAGVSPAVKKNLFAAFDHLSTSNKINTGLWFASAGLGALGAWSSANQIVGVNPETGEKRLHPTAVGATILEAAFAIASAYLGVQSMRSGR